MIVTEKKAQKEYPVPMPVRFYKNERKMIRKLRMKGQSDADVIRTAVREKFDRLQS